jgi:hypothetical protein
VLDIAAATLIGSGGLKRSRALDGLIEIPDSSVTETAPRIDASKVAFYYLALSSDDVSGGSSSLQSEFHRSDRKSRRARDKWTREG